ncbi:MAG: transcription-repair coupling factor [Defluviitaleaceae bacterium]|nr:transcription-repair coupling factor [Defluviitaleaceae bacterium]MCL2263613.1 transcription-repair coupling factor [Defluviitaleaceae bacterium]
MISASHALLEPLKNSATYAKITAALEKREPSALWLNGAISAQKWHLAAAVLRETNRPALIVAPSELKAKEIYQDLYYFMRQNCCVYPSRDLIFYAADVKSPDITRQRLRVIDRLSAPSASEPPRPTGTPPRRGIGAAPVVVLSAEALLDRMVPPETFHRYKLQLKVGDIIEPEEIIRKLVQMGYERSGLAEGPGQFALRGGILDIFPAVGKFKTVGDSPPRPHELFEKSSTKTLTETAQSAVSERGQGDEIPLRGSGQSPENFLLPLSEAQALRIEFFGDDVDSIRVIDSMSQRSLENAEALEVYPVRELVFSRERLKKAVKKIRSAAKIQQTALSESGNKKEAKILADTIDHTLENWSAELGADADAFLPFFYDEEMNLLDYLPKNTLIFFDEPNAIATHMQTVWAEYEESIGHRLMAGLLLPLQIEVMLPWAKILHKAEKFSRVLFSSMAGKLDEFPAAKEIPINSRACMPLRHKPAELKADLENWLNKGYLVALLAGSRRHGEQLSQALNDLEILSRFTETLNGQNLAANLITVTRGTLSAGFEYPDAKLAVITDKEIFTQEKTRRRKHRKQKNAEKINHFTDLRIGDYIVHDNHGIGIFRGIEQVVNDGLSRDYLKLEYKDGGNLYVQTSQMDMLQKYIGGREDAKLSKLGGADWAKAKSRARQAVEILAADLIKLYAERQAAKAHEYAPDTIWQTEFESNFNYTETDDQIAAIEDVKRDMESSRVMDRLICGDVGYGKTEVAIRAAFKAVQDGKQVAYLVPTTILAQQHYQTFASRMESYPVTVERLSRFQSRKEQTETLKNMEKGSSDIVIGTHRLLSKDVKFKDLGLIIVDEEQRFGVGHKEKLKALRANVDVLTLTATPIPRTLHFSLTGIRDMSLLDEPPEERQPIQTYVMENNPEFVRDAINRELARGGQVYYLHNRVRNISEEAARVAQLVPQARIAFAHGQMSETELENIMHDFVDGELDVLVCTTIIETGLDIPNVNTIIIQNADFMGLSQLYQLRGRVGRSSRLAYAYLMYRRDKVLREESEKRLQTIREFTEFGAGFKIAMRDLEIRGAGNLLGQQQHGHMDSVGYDMYCKLLAEAVGEMRGEAPAIVHETNIDISVDAFIPSRLIPDEQQKLEIYKKISLISSQQDYFDVQEEIEDRYGTMPPPVVNLLDVALMKAEARSLGIISVNQKGLNIILTFRADAPVNPDNLMRLIQLNPARLLFTMAQTPYITIRAYKNEKPPEDGGVARIKEIRELLGNLAEG